MADRPDSLARLRADLARLGGQVQQLQAAVAATTELAGAIDDLGTRVERLADQLDPPGAGPAVGRPPEVTSWLDIRPERAPAALADLARWIATVLAYHRVVDHLQPCWYRHPGLVQVLLDVRAAWLVAYREPAGGGVPAALDWSQRHLPHLERQVQEALGRCSDGRHEPAAAPVPIADEPALHGYALWWATDRRPATEPAPPAPAPGVPRPRKAPGPEPARRPASDPGAV
ncbi:MAG: hypothetical protein GEV12_14620 [Micromonosporaceae bacterium]|nr:hypothetical protein [Micromonosporaceae bacterium]